MAWADNSAVHNLSAVERRAFVWAVARNDEVLAAQSHDERLDICLALRLSACWAIRVSWRVRLPRHVPRHQGFDAAGIVSIAQQVVQQRIEAIGHP